LRKQMAALFSESFDYLERRPLFWLKRVPLGGAECNSTGHRKRKQQKRARRRRTSLLGFDASASRAVFEQEFLILLIL